ERFPDLLEDVFFWHLSSSDANGSLFLSISPQPNRRNTMDLMEHHPQRDGLSRRQFLRLARGITGLAALAACTAAPSPAAAPTPTALTAGGEAAQPAVSQEPSQLVISISSDVPEAAQEAMNNAYRDSFPDVELIWELPVQDAGQYPQWLGTQVAAG